MRERLEQVLKVICLALAVLLLVQLVKGVFEINPLAGVSVPVLPSLPPDTNKVAAASNPLPMKPGANSPATNAAKTNATSVAADTNAASKAKGSESNSTTMAASQSIPAVSPTTNGSGTNVMAESPGTNAGKTLWGTNAAIVELVNTNGTNTVAAKNSKSKNKPAPHPAMMAGAMFPGGGGNKVPSLPPEIQARVDRVTDSEILAPVIHPMPMALLGIAGTVAFLRAPNGQTGLVKEGDSLGEIKLLRIGINRVLIEQDGQKKELMIFSGYGGESLLPKSTENANETTKN